MVIIKGKPSVSVSFRPDTDSLAKKLSNVFNVQNSPIHEVLYRLNRNDLIKVVNISLKDERKL